MFSESKRSNKAGGKSTSSAKILAATPTGNANSNNRPEVRKDLKDIYCGLWIVDCGLLGIGADFQTTNHYPQITN